MLRRRRRVLMLILRGRRVPQVVASAIVDKYIGESARVVREMFGYAKVIKKQGCVSCHVLRLCVETRFSEAGLL